ncbi:hypothetical protein T492DRAFT_1031842 [Pavlovales sp. CCMP2436]|nr:hypothetical protein T492DRAFT_1031842 [Pavlovales sp. CCMP2436]
MLCRTRLAPAPKQPLVELALADGPTTEPKRVCMPDKLASEAYICRIDNVLSEAECKLLIRAASTNGFAPALLNMGHGQQILATDVRRSSRSIIDSPTVASELWRRVAEHVPAVWPYLAESRRKRTVVNLNERLRFLKYDPGDFFSPHGDGSYVRENGEASFVTFLLYLNAGYEGGRTTFFRNDGVPFEVEANAGTVVLHDHHILHWSPPLRAGVKHILRTDVMYSKPQPAQQDGPSSGQAV